MKYNYQIPISYWLEQNKNILAMNKESFKVLTTIVQ